MVAGEADVERAPFHYITIDSIGTRPLITLAETREVGPRPMNEEKISSLRIPYLDQ